MFSGKDRIHPRSGSTLTEMMLAIALIVALIVLMAPVFARVKANTDLTRCQRNLREIAAAAFLYAADNGGFLPDRARWGVETDSSRSILPYLGLTATSGSTDTVLTCPAIQRSPYRTAKSFGRRTYSINQYATGSGYGDSTWETQVESRNSPRRLAQVQRPAEQAFFMDGTTLLDGGPGNEGYRFSTFQAPDRLAAAEEANSPSWRTPYIHNDRICVVYLDGHLEMLSRAQAESELVGPSNPSASEASTSPRRKGFWGAEK